MHASLIWVQRVTESLYLLDWSGFIHRLQYLDLYYSMSHICFLCGIWKGLFLKREGSRSLRLQHLTCQVSVSCQTSTSQCYLQPNSCCCFHDVLACLLFVWWSALIFLTERIFSFSLTICPWLHHQRQCWKWSLLLQSCNNNTTLTRKLRRLNVYYEGLPSGFKSPQVRWIETRILLGSGKAAWNLYGFIK